MLPRIACSIKLTPKVSPSSLATTRAPGVIAASIHTKHALGPDMEIRRNQAASEYLDTVQALLARENQQRKENQEGMEWWNGLEESIESSEAIRSYQQDRVAISQDMLQGAVNNVGEVDVVEEEASRIRCGGWVTPSDKTGGKGKKE